MPTYKEPLVGWTDNLYGPMAIVFGAARGLVRVMMVDPSAKIGIVPADYCGNVALACAWKTGGYPGKRGEAENTPIYTFAPSKENQINFGTFINSSIVHRDRFPLTKMLWYPILLSVPPLLFPLFAFFLHILPGYFLDTLLRLKGRKPILLKLYRKIHKNIAIVGPFTSISFNFGTANTQGLLEAMLKQDRSIYDFDMARLDWNDYLRCAMEGTREYIGKDKPTAASLAKALQLINR